MRCTCCNRGLNDFESTAKDSTGQYLDTCNTCLKGTGIPVVGRPDLSRYEHAPSDWLDVGGSPFLDDMSYFEDDK